MNDSRYLNMREAGKHIGQTYRWMQRHYVGLIQAGVRAYRIPKDAPKGHLMFDRESLETYLLSCRLEMGKCDIG